MKQGLMMQRHELRKSTPGWRIVLLSAGCSTLALSGCTQSFLEYSVNEDGKVRVTEAFDDHDHVAETLKSVIVGIPENFADGKLKRALDDIAEGRNDYREEIDGIEIIFIVRGSVYGTRCHDQSGSYHCHPNR